MSITPLGEVGLIGAVKLLQSHGTYAPKVLASEGVPQRAAPDLAYALDRLSFASRDGVAAVAMPVLGGGRAYETLTPEAESRIQAAGVI